MDDIVEISATDLPEYFKEEMFKCIGVKVNSKNNNRGSTTQYFDFLDERYEREF